MRRSWLTLVFALLILAPPVGAQQPAPPPSVLVTTEDGRVSLDVREAPLRRVLDEIGDRTGVRVRLDDAGQAKIADEIVTIQMESVPVETALRRLLRDKDLVLVYAPNRLAEAHVYGRSTGRPAAEPPPAASVGSGPAAAAESRDTLARLREQALTNTDVNARAQALEGLAAQPDQRAVRDVVLEVLDRESDPRLLQRALDIVGPDRTIPLEPLVKLAASSPAPEVRIKALTQLVEHATRDPRVRQTLETAAAGDPEPNVRDAARTLLQRVAAP
jgi:HEAT repeats